MYALVDCNNFYASCERLFRPDLRGKPILVLSNNDGCIIARSNEAKALGIQMGGPYFKVEALCKRYKVHVFSSNYILYGDMSRRVMSVLEESCPAVEIYSIDEAFLDLSNMHPSEINSFCSNLQKKVLRYTGLPVSIGIGSTKTLAKLANHIAKKELQIPVFNISQQHFWLTKIGVGNVWGVGWRWAKKLELQGIRTAHDLASIELRGLKDRFNVMLQRTALELNGISCLDIQEPESRKSIISSKSFGRQQTHFHYVAQAISSHCARACEKLRQQGSVAGYLSIFLQTNRFRLDLPQYNPAVGFKLITPSDDIRYLTQCAKLCLYKIFKKGFYYQKVGVYLSELMDKNAIQLDLFDPFSAEQRLQSKRFMDVFDAVNEKYGRHTIRLAAEGNVKPWDMRSQHRSPSYTTQWQELPIVF